MDLSIYQERPFRGGRLIGVSLAVLGTIWLGGFVIPYAETPPEFRLGLVIVSTIASVLYIIGFWRGVEAKGYPRVLFLAAFTGIIGEVDPVLWTGEP